jgi:hypothetical protein
VLPNRSLNILSLINFFKLEVKLVDSEWVINISHCHIERKYKNSVIYWKLNGFVSKKKKRSTLSIHIICYFYFMTYLKHYDLYYIDQSIMYCTVYNNNKAISIESALNLNVVLIERER